MKRNKDKRWRGDRGEQNRKQDVGFLWQIHKEYRSEVPIMSYLFSQFEAVHVETLSEVHIEYPPTLTAHKHGHTDNFSSFF